MVEKTNTTSPEVKRLLHFWLMITGVALLIGGAVCFAYPALLEQYFGLDGVTAMTFAGVISFAGLMDILIARFIFKGQNRL